MVVHFCQPFMVGQGGTKRTQYSASRDGGGESVPDIKNPKLSDKQQRRQLDYIQSLNRVLQRDQYHPGVEGVIESYELAWMKDAMPELWIRRARAKRRSACMESMRQRLPISVNSACWPDVLSKRVFGSWRSPMEINQHVNLTTDHKARAEACDLPIAGLLRDLKQRGLLKDTLVIWGGEFGRTPAAQGGDGRNHNNKVRYHMDIGGVWQSRR